MFKHVWKDELNLLLYFVFPEFLCINTIKQFFETRKLCKGSQIELLLYTTMSLSHMCKFTPDL